MNDEIQKALDALYVEIDSTAKAGTSVLSQELQKVVNDAADDYQREFTHLDTETWEAIYKPALMARIYTHLAAGLKETSEAWEDVFFQTLKRKYEEER